MARIMRGHPTTPSQPEGEVKPETNLNVPQQEGHPDTAECRDIADYSLDVGYEQVTQEQREVNPDAEYAKIEMPRSGTIHHRMMP